MREIASKLSSVPNQTEMHRSVKDMGLVPLTTFAIVGEPGRQALSKEQTQPSAPNDMKHSRIALVQQARG
jgi:hypothetical protein